jgi:hypothetical protein
MGALLLETGILVYLGLVEKNGSEFIYEGYLETDERDLELDCLV